MKNFFVVLSTVAIFVGCENAKISPGPMRNQTPQPTALTMVKNFSCQMMKMEENLGRVVLVKKGDSLNQVEFYKPDGSAFTLGVVVNNSENIKNMQAKFKKCEVSNSNRLEQGYRIRCEPEVIKGLNLKVNLPYGGGKGEVAPIISKAEISLVGDAKLIEGEAGRFTLMVDYIMENSVIGVRKDGSELRSDISNGKENTTVRLRDCKES